MRKVPKAAMSLIAGMNFIGSLVEYFFYLLVARPLRLRILVRWRILTWFLVWHNPSLRRKPRRYYWFLALDENAPGRPEPRTLCAPLDISRIFRRRELAMTASCINIGNSSSPMTSGRNCG